MAKEERKRQILESAARLFSARRFDEVLMDDIAREAKVAKGTLYGYFPDKEELYFAVVFEGISKLNEQLRLRQERGGDPKAELRDMMRAILVFMRQNRFFFKLMSVEDTKTEKGRGQNRKRWHEERHRQMEAIEAVLARGAEQGIFRIQHLKVEARILRDMVRSVLLSSDGALEIDEMADMIMRVFFEGVENRS